MSAIDTSRPVSGPLARIGLGARALVYLAVCFLLLKAAATSEEDDGATPGEAFRMIEATTGGRVLLVALTPAGATLRKKAERIPPAVVAKLGASLAELDELRRVLTRVNDAAIAAGALS